VNLSRTMTIGMTIAMSFSLNSPAFAYDSSIDSSFADAGRLTLRNTWLPKVVTDGTHTYVVAASAWRASVVVVSLDDQGQPDPNFGSDGTVTLKPRGDFIDQAVAVDQRGRLLIAGQSDRRFVVVRLTRSGNYDGTFSDDGHTRLGPRDSFPQAIEVDSQGRILVLAADYDSSGSRTRYDTLLYRLLPGGRLDPTFGTSGLREIGLKGSDVGYAISVDRLDRPVMTGWQRAPSERAWVVRLTAGRGRLDTKFSGDGLASVSLGPDLWTSGDAIRAHDGVITVGALSYDPATDRYAMAAFQLNANGKLDTSYAEGGKAQFPQPTGTFIAPMYVDDEGAVIAGGKRRADPDTTVPLIGALTPSGALDAEIGPTGIAELDIGNRLAEVSSVTVHNSQLLVAIQGGNSKTLFTRLD